MTYSTTAIDRTDDKAAICRYILESLPDWFGIQSSIDDYCETVRSHMFWAVFNNTQTIAFLSLLEHNMHTSEIEVMGVLAEYHRQGIGKLLVEAAERYCVEHNNTFMLVKTLDFSSGYEPYARTREFYLSIGFLPLQLLKGYWDEENPCLLMGKQVKKPSDFTEEDLAEAHRSLSSTLNKCEKVLESNKLPKPQRTLTERRAAALKLALKLIERGQAR